MYVVGSGIGAAFSAAYDTTGQEKLPDLTDPNDFLPTLDELSVALQDPESEMWEANQRSRAEWEPAALDGIGLPLMTVGYARGIYRVAALVDPGEAGCVWAEVRHGEMGHRLSVRENVVQTRTLVPEPPQADSLLCCAFDVTVSEGSSRYQYPACTEVWFRPVSGEPDRRLAGAKFDAH